MTTTATDQHTPQRPSWDCSCCGKDWPCSPARIQLSEQYGPRRTDLAVYMAVQLGHAAGDLPAATTSTQLYERFIEWTRP
ncbi:hypothetical protein Pa4123_26080 [Phytohabitans aurantiacus]|uniref:Flavin reductase n=1 Tax=Phytohabitans aurantiacus TaxID=3016789 RepID=A0ABQ5QRW1_9ACTN|nr:hypothetical protein Pa4123_26080 [Phytohabitans aurantiacus]